MSHKHNSSPAPIPSHTSVRAEQLSSPAPSNPCPQSGHIWLGLSSLSCGGSHLLVQLHNFLLQALFYRRCQTCPHQPLFQYCPFYLKHFVVYYQKFPRYLLLWLMAIFYTNGFTPLLHPGRSAARLAEIGDHRSLQQYQGQQGHPDCCSQACRQAPQAAAPAPALFRGKHWAEAGSSTYQPTFFSSSLQKVQSCPVQRQHFHYKCS